MSTKTNEPSALQLFLSGTTIGFLLGGIVLLLLVPTAVKPIQIRLKQWVGCLFGNSVLGRQNTTATVDSTTIKATDCCTGTSNHRNTAEQWLDDPYETEVGY